MFHAGFQQFFCCTSAVKVIEAINRMPNHLTAGIVSNNPVFINEAQME